MPDILQATALHTPAINNLERSLWFGPNLITILARSCEVNGAFSLLKNVLRQNFEPPLHVHTREDESQYILEGEIMFSVGDECIHAKPGDYVHLPKNVPHTFKLITKTATILLITPGGFEEMFITCSRPALCLALPPVNNKPSKEFFEKMHRENERLGVTFFPSL